MSSTGYTTSDGPFVQAVPEPSPHLSALPSAPIRKLPRRVVAIALPAPYDEFQVTAWVNFPKTLARELNSGDETRTLAALCQIVTAHDLVDEEGRDYPPATDPAFWDAISNDLGAAIVQAVIGQIGKLDPKPSAT